jgi:hypothetical protein
LLKIYFPVTRLLLGMKNNSAGTTGELLGDKNAGENQCRGTAHKESGGRNFEKDDRRAELSDDAGQAGCTLGDAYICTLFIG